LAAAPDSDSDQESDEEGDIEEAGTAAEVVEKEEECLEIFQGDEGNDQDGAEEATPPVGLGSLDFIRFDKEEEVVLPSALTVTEYKPQQKSETFNEIAEKKKRKLRQSPLLSSQGPLKKAPSPRPKSR
jgi:hypothetical protein